MRIIFYVVALLITIQFTTALNAFRKIKTFIDESSSNANGARSIWAVLVAGSQGYGNYRHQADVLHAYQLLVSRGVPRNQIITMMYDDIAYSTDNPFQGQVYNIPGGPNVYSGVTIDYHRNEVTPETFLSVLTRNETFVMENKPVLRSTETDNVFIYFADHGGTGLIAFPRGELYADQLQEAFATMHQKLMYNKLVIYMEACESGSMFQNFSSSFNVYALTAANADESSFACFWNNTLYTFTGDCFSVNWLLDSDKEDLTIETINTQYNIVRDLTTTSHVMHYGQMSILQDKVGEYQGMKTRRSLFNDNETIRRAKNLLTIEKPVKQVNVELMTLTHQLASAQTDQKPEIILRLKKLFQNRMTIKKILKAIIQQIKDSDEFSQLVETRNNEPIDFNCYRSLLKHFRKQCSHIIDFESYDVLQHFYKFKNLCQQSIPIEFMKDAIDNACNEKSIY